MVENQFTSKCVKSRYQNKIQNAQNSNKEKKVFNPQYYRRVQKEMQRSQKMLFEYMKQAKKADPLLVNNQENGGFKNVNKNANSN